MHEDDELTLNPNSEEAMYYVCLTLNLHIFLLFSLVYIFEWVGSILWKSSVLGMESWE